MTKIGEIPEEWEVVEMGDNKVSELVMGQSPPSSSYNTSGNGIPFLQGNADFGEVCPSPRIYCTKPLKVAEKGDILLSVRAPVGELNIAAFKCVIGRGLAAIRCKNKQTHYKYLYYYLKYSVNRLRSMSTGSTFKEVGKDILSHFEICIPDFEEQQKIAEILTTVDHKLDLLRNKKTHLEKLKKGLMGDLLTGNVRVKINTAKGEN
jgi:type I restriction enzyme S subunit